MAPPKEGSPADNNNNNHYSNNNNKNNSNRDTLLVVSVARPVVKDAQVSVLSVVPADL